MRFEFPVVSRFVTLTGIVPAFRTKKEGTVTVIEPAVTDVGINTAVPKFTYAPETKFDPESVSVNV